VLTARDLRRVAPNYGVLNNESDYPLLRERLARRCQLRAKDRMLPGGAKVEAILSDGGVPHDVREYPDVGHSFMNDSGCLRRCG